MNVGIIGCGLIGRKRALNLCGDTLLSVCDIDKKRAKKLAVEFKCGWTADYREIIKDEKIDIVIVSVINKYLAPISIEAIKNGKHTLVEKPVATSPAEINKFLSVYRNLKRNKSKVIVKTGFNHRFHPGLLKAKEIFDCGEPGPLMYIRARYGHGGRLGYHKEWRAKKHLSGGGELLDQGMHLIDLSLMFEKKFKLASGYCDTHFWDMKVEDNCFAVLRTPDCRTAFLHTSWTEWKNIFSFEIFCKYAKIQVDGLGGSYGPEKLTYYKMKKKMGIPDIKIFEFPGEDSSWKREYENFREAIKNNIEPCGSLEDAANALRIAFAIYAGK